MIYEKTTFTLKDGRTAILRSPCEDDAAEMLDFIRRSSGETVFLMKYPEECDSYTLEKERELFRLTGEDPYSLMIACVVDGRIAANCLLAFRNRIKEAHRASVSVTVLKEYWGLGIGTKLMRRCAGSPGKGKGSCRSSWSSSRATSARDACMRRRVSGSPGPDQTPSG